MIAPAYVRLMAAYAGWQNGAHLGAADRLDDAARRAPRGAFFGSIHATMAHLLWADSIWMHRLAGLPRPQARTIAASVDEGGDWPALSDARRALDGAIGTWAGTLCASDLDGDLTWSSAAAGREVTLPRTFVILHVFNHQTHHRGQIHAMLTAAGADPGDSDLFLMPQALLPRDAGGDPVPG